MKFLYEYQDKSNKRHRGALNAATRADAYAALKAQGIKPIRCDEAPGLVNLVFGKGKRWLAIAALVLALGLTIYYSIVQPSTSNLQPLAESIDSPIRRQLLGDAAVIEKGIRTGWADVFALEGDRFLASFAVPGVPPAVRTTTEEGLKKALETSVFADSSALEARQVSSIVSGMKKEVNSLIASGWTLREVGAALAQRQEQEIAYYERAKTEVETAAKAGMSKTELEQLLDRQNDALRKLGIRLVSMPE